MTLEWGRKGVLRVSVEVIVWNFGLVASNQTMACVCMHVCVYVCVCVGRTSCSTVRVWSIYETKKQLQVIKAKTKQGMQIL